MRRFTAHLKPRRTPPEQACQRRPLLIIRPLFMTDICLLPLYWDITSGLKKKNKEKPHNNEGFHYALRNTDVDSGDCRHGDGSSVERLPFGDLVRLRQLRLSGAILGRLMLYQSQ